MKQEVRVIQAGQIWQYSNGATMLIVGPAMTPHNWCYRHAKTMRGRDWMTYSILPTIESEELLKNWTLISDAPDSSASASGWGTEFQQRHLMCSMYSSVRVKSHGANCEHKGEWVDPMTHDASQNYDLNAPKPHKHGARSVTFDHSLNIATVKCGCGCGFETTVDFSCTELHGTTQRMHAERQRANKLADKLGEARALNAQLNVAANTAIAQYHDLRSFIGSKLRDQFDRLRGKR